MNEMESLLELASEQTPTSEAIAPWRLWAEGAVGLLLAWILTQHFGFQIPAIDAYALIIVLMATRYGYISGVIVGLGAAALSMASAGAGLQDSLSVFTHRDQLALAFTYVALGALIGLVGDWPRAIAQRAQDELSRLKENYRQLDMRYQVLLDAKEGVDRRIVGQAHTIASLYEAARELEILEPKQVPHAMLRLLARFLEVEGASLYLLGDEGLTLAAGLGENERPGVLEPGHPLYEVALTQAPLVVNTRLEYQRAGAYLAAPLTNGEERPRGVVAIEKLPFRQLTTATGQMLSLLADWASRSLAKSETHQRAQEQQRDHPVTGIHRVNHMNDRMAQEWGTAKRYQLPLSVVLVRQANLATAPQIDWEQGAKHIAEVLKARLRNVDVAGHYRTLDTFLILLPVTPLDGAGIFANRLKEALPETTVTLASTQEGYADAEALLQSLQAKAFPELAPSNGVHA
jgi:GGDEF domain-containing protein